MTGDARAFLADRLLRNLDQHLLPFFEQFADLRHHCVLAAAEAASTAPSAPSSIEPAVRSTVWPATLRPLQQPRLRCRTANFRARIHGTVANRLGFEQRLSFRLRFFEFQLLRFSLFGFQESFGNRITARCQLAAACQPGSDLSHSGFRQLSTGRARFFFFQFLKAFIVSGFFAVGCELGFFFLYLLFLHGAVRNVARNIARNIVRDIVRNLRSCHKVRFLRPLVHRL